MAAIMFSGSMSQPRYFIIDGKSELGAHVSSYLCYLRCLRHLSRPRAVANRIFSSCVRKMFWVTIYYQYHGEPKKKRKCAFCILYSVQWSLYIYLEIHILIFFSLIFSSIENYLKGQHWIWHKLVPSDLFLKGRVKIKLKWLFTNIKIYFDG